MSTDVFLQLRCRPSSRYRLRRPRIPCICHHVMRSSPLLSTPAVSFAHAAQSFGQSQRNAGVPSDEVGDGSVDFINTWHQRSSNGVGPRCIPFLLATSCMSSHALPPFSSSLPVLSSSSSGRPCTAHQRSSFTPGPCATWQRPPLAAGLYCSS